MLLYGTIIVLTFIIIGLLLANQAAFNEIEELENANKKLRPYKQRCYTRGKRIDCLEKKLFEATGDKTIRCGAKLKN